MKEKFSDKQFIDKTFRYKLCGYTEVDPKIMHVIYCLNTFQNYSDENFCSQFNTELPKRFLRGYKFGSFCTMFG